MTLRFAPTPLEHPIEAPALRPGGLDPALADAFVPSPTREAQLARLRGPGALAITTGQQPGLFTGPLYTVHKALSAVATASLPPRPADAPLTPMYRQPLGEGVAPALGQLEAGLPASEFRDATLAWLERHYRPDATVAGAYAGAMAELLASSGLLFFDSTHPAAKRAAAPHLVRALRQAAELDDDLDRWAEAQGVTARTSGVTVGDGAALVDAAKKSGLDALVAKRTRGPYRCGAESDDWIEVDL